ncbi:TPA: NAD-dependent epimerase/dehydratase family protein [Candidatus Woesearchaeota archaeon]|nr:NAD-dependent epimerase/dehydratase family protein [Candidatus Woesearchaeota archaeon]HII68355.1 NAD-dependent epimerase/dehydratase family protein [Candidatus Woesearchaeota archaeon]
MDAIFYDDVETIAKAIAEDALALEAKTLLISGGAGFLGNYFIGVIEYLNSHVLKTPCHIISIDNFTSGVSYATGENKDLTTIRHDIKNPLSIGRDVHFIIHAAGLASPKFYRQHKIETIDVATLGTKNLLELARKPYVESMLYFSSSEVYGDPHPAFIPTPETYWGNVSFTGPRSNYDESKRLGEAMCVAYYQTYNLPVKAVRPFNVYGPGMRIDDYRVIPNFVSNLFRGKPLPVYGGGNRTRTFCYVTDAMTGFFKVLFSTHNGEAFNVGNDDEEISIVELAHVMNSLFSPENGVQKTKGINDAYAEGDPSRRLPDLTKIRTLLSYSPEIGLKTGLKRFYAWAKEKYGNSDLPATINCP